jgi:solute carrier family 25 carnitine/acylcarnitine transporter 20/29
MMKHSTRIPFFLLVLFLAILLASAKIPSRSLESLSSFASGGVGGGLSVLVGHPFDLVKVKHQTDANGSTPVGTFATLRDIIRKEGFCGMYRGVSAPLIAVAPIFATSFWGYHVGDKLVRACWGLTPTVPLNVLQLALAGGFSAFPTALVMVPAERIKCLLQTQDEQVNVRGGAKYNGFSDCATKLYQEHGILGLYKGTALTLMRDVPGNMVYFGVYEMAKRFLGNNPAAPLIAGALAGVAFWPVVLPMDCLKSRYQTGSYKNIGQVYSELMQQEGMAGMFRGIKPAMIRSAPANAVSFTGAELTKKALSKFY